MLRPSNLARSLTAIWLSRRRDSEPHAELQLVRARRHEVRPADYRDELWNASLFVRLTTLNRIRSFVRSVNSRLSAPMPRLKRCQGAILGGFATSSRSLRRNPDLRQRPGRASATCVRAQGQRPSSERHSSVPVCNLSRSGNDATVRGRADRGTMPVCPIRRGMTATLRANRCHGIPARRIRC